MAFKWTSRDGFGDEMAWKQQLRPSKMAFQLVRLGDLIIAGVPAEFTTMAGRRTAKAIKKPLVEKGLDITGHL